MMTMIVNIHEAKARLSECLDAAARGERVLICKRNRPIAELRPVAAAPAVPRPVGTAKGRFVVPETFFEPLSAEMLDAFDGVEPAARPSRAAEASERYKTSRTQRPRSRR
jgi:prevent-host-death family protein